MIGDVVLLQNEESSVEIDHRKGVDGRVRATVVQVSGSRNLLKRSIKHLIPIEVQSHVIC